MNNHQAQKAQVFKQLHQRDGIFICPNPWDAGSAVVLASMGFEALATTSGGAANSIGKPDGGYMTRHESLINARSIVNAVSVPVSADLENGYGDEPEFCAETIFLAAEAGLVGGSIEDATGNDDNPIYSLALSVERVKAAVQAARSLPFDFMLTARAENFIHGRPDLDDTIKRLVAFANAGADVLFAPGLRSLDQVKEVVNAVAPKPVNVLIPVNNAEFTVAKLEQLGVKRISVGSTLMRAAYGAFYKTAQQLQKEGVFSAPDQIPYDTLNNFFK